MSASVEALVEEQRGVLTRAQAATCGLSRHALANRVKSGRWQRVYPGVYATVTGGLDVDQHIWAAYLYAGEGATIGFRTAWWLADRKLAEPDRIDVVMPDPRIVQRQPGLRIRRTRRWSALDVHPTAAPPRFRLERAVLDCSASARSTTEAIALLASSVQRRTTTVRQLRAVLLRHPNLPRDQWKDMRRDNRNTVDLGGTLRFPGFLLLTEPHEVATTIAAALTARGWTGTLRCPRTCAGPLP